MDNFLNFSMFSRALRSESSLVSQTSQLVLKRSYRFVPRQDLCFWDHPWVVFDIETTGLSPQRDQIIELGAQKIFQGQVLAEFSTLIACDRPVPLQAQKISGITDHMLVGQPPLETVLNGFLRFSEGALLVAHNATFDASFIRTACKQFGVEWTWPIFCTLKMSRDLLVGLKRRDLDSLAQHYGLSFESRHRSIGDVKVTVGVLQQLLQKEGRHLRMWKDLAPYVA